MRMGEDKNRPIGVFDSGAGGISVLKELVRLMPGENFIFYGDSLHAPYGTRPIEEVRELSYACARHLLDQNVKEIVIACNTATSAACRIMRGMYPELPLVGIEPAVKPAVEGHPGGRVVVMATPLTLREEKFHRLMDKYRSKAEIIPLACPGLVEYVEGGILEGPQLEAYLNDMLGTSLRDGVDAVVLGCTHFPLVKAAIGRIVGPKVVIYDGGNGTARQARRLLKQNDWCSDAAKGSISFQSSTAGKEHFYESLFRRAMHLPELKV